MQLVLASYGQQQRDYLCHVMTSGRIYLLQNESEQVLSDSEFDTENGCLCFSQFCGK
jgi:hypothetical protein